MLITRENIQESVRVRPYRSLSKQNLESLLQAFELFIPTQDFYSATADRALATMRESELEAIFRQRRQLDVVRTAVAPTVPEESLQATSPVNTKGESLHLTSDENAYTSTLLSEREGVTSSEQPNSQEVATTVARDLAELQARAKEVAALRNLQTVEPVVSLTLFDLLVESLLRQKQRLTENELLAVGGVGNEMVEGKHALYNAWQQRGLFYGFQKTDLEEALEAHRELTTQPRITGWWRHHGIAVVPS